MKPNIPEHALVSLIRPSYIGPRCRSTARCCLGTKIGSYSRSYTSRRRTQPQIYEFFNPRRRNYSSTSDVEDKTGPLHEEVAVLGGGITGLAVAHYLSKWQPKTKITLYEATERLGGWLNTKRIDVGDGHVVFEQGPRTLRPGTAAGYTTLNLVSSLGLESEIIATNLNSVAAQNRFIYYPDRLVRMPGPGQDPFATAWSILTEPVFKGIWSSLFEHSVPTRPASLEDESVGSFLNRRLGGPDVGNNVVSAVFHGIYAGDIYKLSARSLMRLPWYLEKAYGSITNGIMETWGKFTYNSPTDTMKQAQESGIMTPKVKALVKDTSVYTFRGGLGSLSTRLEASLRSNPNITFKTDSKIKRITLDKESNDIQIHSNEVQPKHYNKAISTLSGRTLSSLATDDNSASLLPSLGGIESATVMVVNLFFRDPDLLIERGFGYLIPRSIPFEQNPECALGVVFDSDATIGQDTVQGTKLTVMLGGHWWSELNSYPDEIEGVAMARAVLKRHLSIKQEPDTVHVTLQKDCIPQYTVGHHSRLKQAHAELANNFKSKLCVAGSTYTGVGVNDCISAAQQLVFDIMLGRPYTGLESFADEFQYFHSPITKK